MRQHTSPPSGLRSGMPTRTGPCPGSPVIDISPPMPLRDLVHPRPVARTARFLPEPADAPVHDARVHLAHRMES